MADMTPDETKALQKHNSAQLSEMDPSAAGMVQSLLLDLYSSKTFIRLDDPQEFSVRYTFIQGTAEFVRETSEELGLTLTDSAIQVPHGEH